MKLGDWAAAVALIFALSFISGYLDGRITVQDSAPTITTTTGVRQ